MRSTNFVSFLTVQGFFIGFVFSVLKAQSAEGILVYTLLITAFLFIRHTPLRQEYFPKMRHENDLDYYVKEISKREKVIESSYDFLKALDKQYATVKTKKKGA